MSVALLFATLLTAGAAHAATSPSLGIAETFVILSSTYSNSTPGTTLDGDLGYTTPPAVTPTVNGTTYVAPDPILTQAGTDQGVALTALATEICTFTFPPGAVDLASNVQFPSATYPPGVYCATGAYTIGTGGITLEGAGTYIFRTTAELDTAANSEVTLSNGASECDVWWTPIGATTLGANSTFLGTVIDDAGITVGSTVTWEGRALAFGGTVTTDVDTISAPSCSAPSASLTVTKTVVNDDDGTLAVSDFPLFVSGVPVTSGVATTTLAPGSYTVTETSDADYVAGVWGGDCAADGSITLSDGDTATCTITNDDVDAGIGSPSNSSGSRSSSRRSVEPVESTADTASTTVSTSNTGISTTSQATVSGTTVDPLGGSVTSDIPRLPNAGIGPESTLPATFAASLGALGTVLAIMYLRRRDTRASTDAV